MSFAFRAIYNCCWNMFIRRTIYWIVIPCAKLQKIFGITIKLGNNFGVWGGWDCLIGVREKVWIWFEGVWGSGLNKNRKNLLVVVLRSSVAHVAALCACECKRTYLLSPTNPHQLPFNLLYNLTNPLVPIIFMTIKPTNLLTPIFLDFGISRIDGIESRNVPYSL